MHAAGGGYESFRSMHLVVTYNRYRLSKVECVVKYRAFSAGRKAEQGRVRGIDGGRKVFYDNGMDKVLAAVQADWTHAQGSRVHPVRPLGAADTGGAASCRMGFVRFSNAITKIGSGRIQTDRLSPSVPARANLISQGSTRRRCVAISAA